MVRLVFGINSHLKTKINLQNIFHLHKIKSTYILSVLKPGEGYWGMWYPKDDAWKSCPTLSFVSGFRIKIESNQGRTADDTGLNSIELKCKSTDGKET